MRLTTAERHQLKIAWDTLRMPKAMIAIMGGMTEEEAFQVIERLTKKRKVMAHKAEQAEEGACSQ